MSKRIPVYLSQEDLEYLRGLMVDRKKEFPFEKPNKSRERLFDVVTENLMTFEDYEHLFKVLKD